MFGLFRQVESFLESVDQQAAVLSSPVVAKEKSRIEGVNEEDGTSMKVPSTALFSQIKRQEEAKEVDMDQRKEMSEEEEAFGEEWGGKEAFQFATPSKSSLPSLPSSKLHSSSSSNQLGLSSFPSHSLPSQSSTEMATPDRSSLHSFSPSDTSSDLHATKPLQFDSFNDDSWNNTSFDAGGLSSWEREPLEENHNLEDDFGDMDDNTVMDDSLNVNKDGFYEAHEDFDVEDDGVKENKEIFDDDRWNESWNENQHATQNSTPSTKGPHTFVDDTAIHSADTPDLAENTDHHHHSINPTDAPAVSPSTTSTLAPSSFDWNLDGDDGEDGWDDIPTTSPVASSSSLSSHHPTQALQPANTISSASIQNASSPQKDASSSSPQKDASSSSSSSLQQQQEEEETSVSSLGLSPSTPHSNSPKVVRIQPQEWDWDDQFDDSSSMGLQKKEGVVDSLSSQIGPFSSSGPSYTSLDATTTDDASNIASQVHAPPSHSPDITALTLNPSEEVQEEASTGSNDAHDTSVSPSFDVTRAADVSAASESESEMDEAAPSSSYSSLDYNSLDYNATTSLNESSSESPTIIQSSESISPNESISPSTESKVLSTSSEQLLPPSTFESSPSSHSIQSSNDSLPSTGAELAHPIDLSSHSKDVSSSSSRDLASAAIPPTSPPPSSSTGISSSSSAGAPISSSPSPSVTPVPLASSSLHSPSSLHSSSSLHSHVPLTSSSSLLSPVQSPQQPTSAKEALKRLASVQHKLKEQSKLIDTLNHEKQSLMASLRTLKDQNLDLEKKRADLLNKISTLEKEKASIEKEKATLEKDILTLKSSTQSKESNLNHEAVVAHLTDQINRYAAMADDIKQRAEEKREKMLEVLEERKKTIEKLKKENEAHLASIRRDHQLALDHLKEEGSKNINNLEKKIQSLEEARKGMEKQKEDASHLSALHQTQIATLQKEKEALQAQLVHSKRGEEEEAKEAWKWKEEFQRSFEASQSLLQARIDELQAQRDTIAAENANLQEHVAMVVGKREKERRELDDQLSSLKDTLSSSQAQESHLQSLLIQKEDTILQLEQSVEEEKENLNSYRAKASSHLAILSSHLATYQQILSQHSLPDPIASDPENAHSIHHSLPWTAEANSSSSSAVSSHNHQLESTMGKKSPPIGTTASNLVSPSSLASINHHLETLVQLIDSGAFSSFLSHSEPARSEMNRGAITSSISFGDLSNLKQMARQVLEATLVGSEEAEEGLEARFKMGNLSSLSAQSLLPFISSLSHLLLTSSSKLSQLSMELEDAKKSNQIVSNTLSSSMTSDSSLALTLNIALKEKESMVDTLEKELEEVKNELSDLRANHETISDAFKREEEVKEKERKEMEAKREEREMAREEELKKLKRALAARAASAASQTELQAKINMLNDQLIAKQAQVEALEADRRSYEEWASGVPGTASKPQRRASRIPPGIASSSNANSMDESNEADFSADLPLPATSDPSNASLDLELQGDNSDIMSSGAPTTLQSILTGRGLSDAKSRFLTKARTVGREMERKLEKQEWARRVANVLPSTLRARLLLIFYLIFLQVMTFYLMSSSSSCSEVSGSKQDPIID